MKGQTQEDLENLGVQILLSNTYHLYLRPGHELIRSMGGLHKFMAWPRAILTDSGGYQVFSLSELRKVTDGRDLSLPISMAPSIFYPPRKRSKSKLRWARTSSWFSMNASKRLPPKRAPAKRPDTHSNGLDGRAIISSSMAIRPGRRFFGIVQGGTYEALRRENADALVALDFPGYAIGGLAVGEPHGDNVRDDASRCFTLAGKQAALLDGCRQAGTTP